MYWPMEPIEFHDPERLDRGRIPGKQGIYFWRRKFWLSDDAILEGEDLVVRILENLTTPLGRIPNATFRGMNESDLSFRANLLQFQNITLGGEGISAAQETSLREMIGQKKGRLFYQLFRQINGLGQILYVGSSGDIRKRLDEHMSGNSGFAQRISTLGLEINRDTQVGWLELGSSGLSKNELTLVEAIFASLLFAPMTLRKG